MISEGWTWADLQSLTFPQLNLFADKMNERLEAIAKANRS
jgi:hypothetical protein